MSALADVDRNHQAVAAMHSAATAYLAASELPLTALLYADDLAETARDRIADALAELVVVDRRDTAACDRAILAARDGMRALDVALGLAPGAPPLPLRWWAAVVRWAVAAQEARA